MKLIGVFIANVIHVFLASYSLRFCPLVPVLVLSFTRRSSHRRFSVKKVFLKISQISQENTCVQKQSIPAVFCEKGLIRNFAKFAGKHLCQSLFLGLQLC